jgi:hypothetical protein
MRRDTFEAALRQMCHRVPFQRFTVELVNCVRLIGYHPEVFVQDGDLVSYTDVDGGEQLFDASCVARVAPFVIPQELRYT